MKRSKPVQQRQEASIGIPVSFLEVVDISEGGGHTLVNNWFHVK